MVTPGTTGGRRSARMLPVPHELEQPRDAPNAHLLLPQSRQPDCRQPLLEQETSRLFPIGRYAAGCTANPASAVGLQKLGIASHFSPRLLMSQENK